MNQLSWEWIQSFVVVAHCGSLSKAATVLGTSQPTLSRHMAALEQQLGITLFDRSTQGLKITSDGAKLIESSEAMQQGAQRFARLASGATLSLSGEVRISANEVVGLYYLPRVIAEFNLLYPEVTVEVDISNKATSLNKRDADIALRMFRPTQPDLVAKRLHDIELQFTASKDYLARQGEPQTLGEICNHPIIGFDREQQTEKAVEAMGLSIADVTIISKTDFLPLQIELARNGAGITITHRQIIEQFDQLQQILPNVPIPKLELWLVCHGDVQHNRRIRALMDFLAEAFG
ncbi:MAG: LysR family transcriptional regulator [Psychrosphaera sp.]|nr:LysR family transcriptional regulator [Psychrosphaera sp.]